MARKNIIQYQQEAQGELLDYLRQNGRVSYRQAHETLSAAAMQQYRILKRAGRIKAYVAHTPDGISHEIELVEGAE